MGFSILSELYRHDGTTTNPFLPVFLAALEKGSDICEKLFIVHLLSAAGATRDVRVMQQNSAVVCVCMESARA